MTDTEPSTVSKRRIGPKPDPVKRHSWLDSVTVLPSESYSGNEETERECKDCHVVKITIHYPFGIPKRAWRTRDGRRTDKINSTPPCDGGEAL